MTPEQRLDRVERILGQMAVAGRKARSEFRENIKALNEKINILINAQMETTEQIRGLAVGQAELKESQKLTDRSLRAFIDSLRKGGNGNSST